MEKSIWEDVVNEDTLKQDVKDRIENWVGNPEDVEVLFFWSVEEFDEYHFVIRYIRTNTISGLRIFGLGNRYELSEDYSRRI